MKIKILSDRIVGHKVGAKVDVDDLEADGVNVRQWVRCGLAEYVKPPAKPAGGVPADVPADGGDA